jgi:cystathionine beta-synthase
MAAAVRGYKCIIVLPEKMSKEKVDVLKALGAEIIRTPTEAAWDAPDSHISVAKKLQRDTPNSHILDQYTNPANPLAHYDGTAEEILQQLDGKVDMIVAGAGTGGTISGVAAKIKERCPHAEIVGVDPVGSILALPDSMNDEGRLNSYFVEGIGYDFIPGVLDRSLVDTWMKSNDSESLVMMRSLIRNEGLLCGGSSGAAVSCAIKAASRLKEGQNCVVILPDSVRNYMTKALSDEWMIDHNFIDNEIIRKKQYRNWWANKRVCDLDLNTPLTISWNVKCKDAIALLKNEGFDMVPVIDADGDILGVVTEGNMTRMIVNGRAQPNTSVADAGVVYKTFRKMGMNTLLSDLASALDIDPYALITTEQRCFARKRRQRAPSQGSESDQAGAQSAESNDEIMAVVNKSVVSGIVTRIDLLEFIARGE